MKRVLVAIVWVTLTCGLGAAPATATPPNSAPAAATVRHSNHRHTVGAVLGALAVLGVLVAWSEGFGLLGGRPASLSARSRPPSDRE
jgi:hypothetical protein